MAKPNYAFEKRQRELAKKKKKEEKKLLKAQASERAEKELAGDGNDATTDDTGNH